MRSGIGNRWWWLRVSRYEVKIRIWVFDLIVERGSIRSNLDNGFNGVAIDLPSILFTIVDPRRLDRWER
jgi:hypothetical protein